MITTNPVSSHLLRTRIGKLCVAITGSSIDDMIARATEAVKETTFVEFRLDYLPMPAKIESFHAFFAEHTEATAIGTCRCEANGGKFTGSNDAAIDVLLQAAKAGFQIVDVELEVAEKIRPERLDELRATGAALIVSHHDFEATRDLDALLARIKPFAPEFIKICPTAQSLSDNLTMMRFLEREGDSSNSSLVGVCMGEAGVISRVLGLRAGSAFTFAAAHAGEETAPGQIAARTLLETYRIDQVDAATKVFGVAGDPIRTSLSPLMMNTAFRRETVNAVYLALQTRQAEDLFNLVREIPIQGLSVTMPLKRDIIPMLERTDPLSTKIGAVNTVLRAQDGKFYGFNTDVAGIVVPLERRIPLAGTKVLVLGAGGAARAAVFGLKDKGADVSILNRTLETAQKLAKQAGAKVIKREAVAKAGFDIIVNATPVGMAGNAGLPLLQAEDVVAKIVFDLVYNPIDTPLLQLARQKGCTVITGVEMFVQQGARQFEIWTGKPAPTEEMLRVVLHSLRQSTGEPTLPGVLEAARAKPADAEDDVESGEDAPATVAAPSSAVKKLPSKAAAPAAAPAGEKSPAVKAAATPLKAPSVVAKVAEATSTAKPSAKAPGTKGVEATASASKISTDKPLAVKSVAAKSVAVKTVPAKSVAAKPVPAKPVPARSILAKTPVKAPAKSAAKKRR